MPMMCDKPSLRRWREMCCRCSEAHSGRGGGWGEGVGAKKGLVTK